MNKNEIYKAGEDLLRAIVAVKAGDVKSGVKLFAKVANSDTLNPISDGIAKGILRLKAEDEIMDDEEILDEEEDLDAKCKAGDEEDLTEDEDVTEEDMGEEDVEIPASVAKVLGFKV